MKVLIDNGHGANTPGKRSPDGRLMEYAYAREIAARLEAELRKRGVDAVRVVREELDVPLGERCRRANEYRAGEAILVSIHCNAAGNGANWMKARGWEVYVSKNASAKSKALADRLYDASRELGLTVRPESTSQQYRVKDLAICRDTRCPAVLTENLFQDNKEDVDFLLSDNGKQTIVKLHVEGIIKYIKSLEK